MDKYELKTNEVVLFEANILIPGTKGSNNLILTNLNIVIENTVKKAFKRPETKCVLYPVSDVKIYNELPQIKQKGQNVIIYFSNGELSMDFSSMIQARKFVEKAIELISGKNLPVRGAGKVKNAIGLVDDTLGIDTMGAISGVIENGILGTIFKGKKHKDTDGIRKNIQTIATVTSDTIRVKEEQETQSGVSNLEMSYDEKIEAVKKFKELLDMGIISQDEFDKKKKDLLDI